MATDTLHAGQRQRQSDEPSIDSHTTNVTTADSATSTTAAGTKDHDFEKILQPILDRYVRFWFGRGFMEKDEWGVPPLLEALYAGDEASTFLLLLHANQTLTPEGATGKRRVGDFLNVTNASYMLMGRCCGDRVWHAAIWGCNPSCLNLLLQSSSILGEESHRMLPDLHAKNSKGQNLLHVASIVHSFERQRHKSSEQTSSPNLTIKIDGLVRMVETLAGLYPYLLNEKDHDGYTPLATAAYFGCPNIAKILIEGGSDIQSKDNGGSTPLHLAASRRDGVPLINLLIEHGADVNSMNLSYRTPLHFALDITDETNVSLLLKFGANPRILQPLTIEGQPCNRNGWTPMDSSIYMGCVEISKLLLPYYYMDENVESGLIECGEVGHSPLHTAATTCLRIIDADIFRLIVEVGGPDELSTRDEDGRTPFEKARFVNNVQGERAIVELMAEVASRKTKIVMNDDAYECPISGYKRQRYE